MKTGGRRHLAALLIVACALALAACSGSKSAPTPTPTVPPRPAVYASASCPVGAPAGQDMQCGYLAVPENRSKPDSHTIKLAVAVIKSTSPNPAPDPMIYLSGGPGQPGLADNMQAFSKTFAEPVQSKRDLVFLDQRGTGYSQPLLGCPETNDAFRAALAQDIRNDAQNAGANAAVKACHDRLAKDGIDFSGYSSKENALDVKDLMHALGYAKYNVYGVSYGTRLALEVMRQDPQHVRSVILDSTLPPQVTPELAQSATFQRAVNTLVSGCDADTKCESAYPDLESTYFALVAKANQQPITVQPTDGATGQKATVVVNGDRILSGTFQALYDTSLIPLLPFAAKQIATGNTAILEQIAQQVAFANLDIAQAMNVAVECNDTVMSQKASDVAAATKGVRPEILAGHLGVSTAAELKDAQDVCRLFGITSTVPGTTDPVTSDIPTLVLAGEYDPVTPPDWGKLAAKTLSHSYFFQFPASGHGELFGRRDCAIALAATFLDDPSQAPDGSCVSSIAEPAFLTP
ncbi:MAG TPA: alpha/beta hydrolase [Dehalococcoidia bacterium]|nr:alpha/beta hydrolase [Dehalococcoidia bacterium]